MNYWFHLAIYFTIFATVAISLNIVTGYCGLFTLAHAAYFAIGSYTFAIASANWGWSFLPAAGLGVVVAVILSLALSVPSWRFRGDNFLLMSLAVQAMLAGIFQNWWSTGSTPGSWTNLTNGASGMSVRASEVFGLSLREPGHLLLLGIGILLVCAFITRVLLSSPFGRLLVCMRDDELALRGLGKNVRLARVQALAIASGIVALAGALYAAYARFVDPQVASLDQSILMLAVVLIGGTGNFRGPLVGAVCLIAIEEGIRFLPFIEAGAGTTARVIGGGDVVASLRIMAYGLLLVLLMHFRPQGIAGRYRTA